MTTLGSTAHRRLVSCLPQTLAALHNLVGETRLEAEMPLAVTSVYVGVPKGGEAEHLERAPDLSGRGE